MTDARDAARDVERYEQLRVHALEGGPSGFSLGLALLERRGGGGMDARVEQHRAGKVSCDGHGSGRAPAGVS